MEVLSYTKKECAAILNDLQTTSQGLSPQQVTQKKQIYGPNTIKGTQITWLHILLRQFKSPFLYLLIGASVLSMVLGERLDGLMILLFVLIDTLLGFYQEYKSEQTLKLLTQFVSTKSKVIRDSKEIEIESSGIVPGDIVILEAGDIVSADIRLIEARQLNVDESVLTGESVSVTKSADRIHTEVKELYQASNICFSGTTVVDGSARGVVLQTGSQTALGEIAHLTNETERVSSFEKGINHFSTFILKLILGTLVCIFIINVLIKGPSQLPMLMIFSVALAVSVIPEALPVVMTFSLARGALRLAKNKVVVKRLSSIEDLGSIEILCTDKTGTLTENKMTVDSLYPDRDTSVHEYAALASSLREVKNKSTHSFDFALWNGLTAGQHHKLTAVKKFQELPFDPHRKRNSVLIQRGKFHELIVRGAPEVIMKLCTHLSPTLKLKAEKWVQEQGLRGKRVIAVAKKIVESEHVSLVEEEQRLSFVGLVSFVDPIKFSAAEAVRQAEKLGVTLKILTGDSREVAGAVAYKIGIIDNLHAVITGDEFEELSHDKQRKAVLEYDIFARVSPQQKYKVIQMLQEKHEVGFLGEGINDAPALKIANVAIVVDGATDVAREASDIILLQKNLMVIINGIKEGRAIFSNTAKYIRSTLASNFGNFYTVAIASLFIDFLPLLPLQILLINLLTDFPMIAVATDHIDPNELHSPRQYDIKDIALFGTVLGVVSSVFDSMFFLIFYQISPSVLQTNWALGSILTELVFLFSIRTRLPFYKAQRPSSTIVILSSVAALTALIIPYTLFGQHVFEFTPPSARDLLIIFGLTAAYFIATEKVKSMYYTFIQNHTHKK